MWPLSTDKTSGGTWKLVALTLWLFHWAGLCRLRLSPGQPIYCRPGTTRLVHDSRNVLCVPCYDELLSQAYKKKMEEKEKEDKAAASEVWLC